MKTWQDDLALSDDQRRLADSNCWTSPLAPAEEKPLHIAGLPCLLPLRGKGPTSYVPTPGPLDTPCWIWQGSLNSKGYPLRGTRDGGVYLVHRRVLEERDGWPLPRGIQAHHRCEVKQCVNPAHLERLTSLQHGRLHTHDGAPAMAEQALTILADGRAYRVAELARHVGASPSSMAVALGRCVTRGELRRVAKGTYALPLAAVVDA